MTTLTPLGKQRADERRRKMHEAGAAASREATPQTALRLRENWAHDAWLEALRERPKPDPWPRIPAEALAEIARHIQVIRDERKQPLKYQVVSLVDAMHANEYMRNDLWNAADWFRERWFTWRGRSEGVSNYGEFEDRGDPSRRVPTSDRRMAAFNDVRAACIAMFGVPVRGEEFATTGKVRWTIDEHLMRLVLPAILSIRKGVSQKDIAMQRCKYQGRAQVAAAGGTVITECLERLFLHWRQK